MNDNYYNRENENENNRTDNSSYTSYAGYNGNRYEQYNYSDNSHVPPRPDRAKEEKVTKKGTPFWQKALACVALGLIFGAFAGAGLFAVNLITGGGDKGDQVVINETTESALPEKDDTTVNTTEESGKKVTTTQATTAITAQRGDVANVAENVMPAVVSITNNYTYTQQDFFGQQFQGESSASGSGIIVGQNDSELLIATNQHVVSSADSLNVQFIDGTTADAQLKGQDSSADIAVIAVPLSSLEEDTLKAIKISTLGDSENLQVGQQVVAIGNALGYGQSVTTGIISALNREVSLSNGTHELIQTDAAINPGNSGGALLDMDGNLVGINEAKLSGGGIEGMGYAIPISNAKPVIDNLMNKETKEIQENHGFLGISGADINAQTAETYDMPQGIYISKVAKSLAADKGGLKKGDIITEFDGQPVQSMSQLQELIQYYEVGKTVEVTYYKQSDEG
ncbi:MAG: trypsin-like peptidase domain-containing protein, partial [Lachnospiraceae bacterium]|nr:trypsin-like peptidase domain-containing protein [Lachnospiraceae bacterium]